MQAHHYTRTAAEVSGESPLVGLFLPYTPLHHLLLRDAGVPLVMTSGNLSDEPMVTVEFQGASTYAKASH